MQPGVDVGGQEVRTRQYGNSRLTVEIVKLFIWEKAGR